ncbi:hypothetical protein [Alteromonas sp. C1M14]|uniref:hypothetical protein n=1 Tax=Alteromonas sp. C1M14 TaxID=2841567 RepID=UPI001C080E4C|nr:hypothetical protein [Alteromonas sp. C1M14]MBU2980178.1 hypothetical protein [Alteromonas sp. C1M14]
MSRNEFKYSSRYRSLSISQIFLYVGIIILITPQLLELIGFIADLYFAQAPEEGKEQFKSAYSLRILAGSFFLSFIFLILSFLLSKFDK